MLFSLRFPGRTLARSLIIVPWLLPLIVTGVIFRFLFQVEGGAVNQLLSYVGLADRPIDWLDNPHLALWTILIANIWLGVPFFTLLLYSALQDVPTEVREAAVIDGAGPWQRLRLIIVPIILPVIEVTLLLGFVFTVKVFDLVIGLTGGGPANSTQLITTWSYSLSFQTIFLRPGRCTQQPAARAGADLRAVLPVAQPGLVEAQLGGRQDDPPAEVEGPAMALHARGGRCPRDHAVPGVRDHRRLVRVDPDPVQRHVSTGCRTRRHWTTTELFFTRKKATC